MITATILAIALIMPAQSDNTDHALTIYSSAQPGAMSPQQLQSYASNPHAVPGFAMVQSVREIELERGRNTIQYTDVAAGIDPTTVRFISLTDDNTRVLEQNYQFDLVSPDKLLERYLDREITVIVPRSDGVEEIRGTLLSANNGLTLSDRSGEVRIIRNAADVALPELPGGLLTKPTLLWLLDTDRGGNHRTRLSYETKGMTWWADYNLTVDETEDCKLDVAAWVSIANQAGASFDNAKLKLIAGDINRARPDLDMMRYERRQVAMAAPMVDEGFSEESFFEYHLYTLGRRADLPDKSTKQLELFPTATGVPCRKQLIFDSFGRFGGYYSPQTDRGFGPRGSNKPSVFIEFENRERDGLGLPMPRGRVRVSQANPNDGSLELIGEDTIDHTPRNETLRLRLGEAFDVVGERTQTDFQIDTRANWIRESFEIEVRNQKAVAQRVMVRETLYRWSNWEIEQASHDYDQRNAHSVVFELDVPPEDSETITFTVYYRW